MSTLNLDKLREIQRKLADIPPPPYLVSWSMLPADNFVKFTHAGQEYWGAHPDLWDKLPKGTLEQMGNAFTQIVVHNLDASEKARMRFCEAYAAVMEEAARKGAQTETATTRSETGSTF